MAHDRQVAERSSDTNEARKPSKTSSDIVADWLTVYAKVYREEVQEELVLAYLESLKELRPGLLHQAFLRAMKRSKFRPTPAEVHESYEVVAEIQTGGNRPKYLDEPKLSVAEREAAVAAPEYQELRRKIVEMGHNPKCLCRECRERRERS